MNDFLLHDIGFMPGIESFCYQNCLRIILGLQGIENPELHLNSTLSLNFDISKGQIDLDGNIRKLLPSEDNCVIRKYYDSDYSAHDVFEENIKYITEHNSPIIVGVDSFFLPYATNAGINHARHTLILCGWNEKTKEVDIIDWYPPWYFKGSIGLTDFLLARTSKNEYDGSIYSGVMIGNNWAVVEGVKQRNRMDLLSELLDTVNQKYYKERNEKILYGPEAIEAMKGMLMTCSEASQYDDLHKRLWNIEKRYRFFAGYLECVGKDIFYDEIEKIVYFANSEADEWDKMLMLSAKGRISPSDKVRDKFLMRIDKVLSVDHSLKKYILLLCEKVNSYKEHSCNP